MTDDLCGPATGGEGATFHETSTWRPVVIFALTAGAWVSLVALGLRTESVPLRAALAVLLAGAAAQLFMIGHDAAHRSFSRSRAANEIVGRLAFLPSMHVYGLWRAHHDIHHRFTNLKGHDFVWTPLTLAEYRRLPRRRRFLHRLYRGRFGAGFGLHYVIEIWAPRMLWPRRIHQLPGRRLLVLDAVAFQATVITLGWLAHRWVVSIDAERAGDPRFWTSAVLLLFVVPLVASHWLIDLVIYLNHTHPDIVWYDDPDEWAAHDIPVECSAAQRISAAQLLMPRRILNHTAHHVDPGIPLRLLAPAQRDLESRRRDDVPSHDWSTWSFGHILGHCKIYDYEAHRWLMWNGSIPAR